MARSSMRRLAALVATLALALSFPLATSATIGGGCTGEGHATSSSVDLVTATEWHVKSADTAGGSGTSPGPIKAASIGAYALGISIPIVSGTSDDGETTGSVDGVSVALFGILGHRFVVAGSGTGDATCTGQIEIIIDDVNPLLTVLGGGGIAAAIIGYLLVLRTLRGGNGLLKRILDAIYGLLGGLGLALSLEQLGYIEPTQLLGLFIVIASALFGFLTAGLLGGGKKPPVEPTPTPTAAPAPPPPAQPTSTPDPGPLPDPGGDERPTGKADEYPGSEQPVGGGGAI